MSGQHARDTPNCHQPPRAELGPPTFTSRLSGCPMGSGYGTGHRRTVIYVSDCAGTLGVARCRMREDSHPRSRRWRRSWESLCSASHRSLWVSRC